MATKRHNQYEQANKSMSEMLEQLYNEMTPEAQSRVRALEQVAIYKLKMIEGSQEMGPVGAHELVLRMVAATGGAILL